MKVGIFGRKDILKVGLGFLKINSASCFSVFIAEKSKIILEWMPSNEKMSIFTNSAVFLLSYW